MEQATRSILEILVKFKAVGFLQKSNDPVTGIFTAYSIQYYLDSIHRFDIQIVSALLDATENKNNFVFFRHNHVAQNPTGSRLYFIAQIKKCDRHFQIPQKLLLKVSEKIFSGNLFKHI